MKLAVFLPLGGSIEGQKASGQFDRFNKYYLSTYYKASSEVYLITYGQEIRFTNGVTVLNNPLRIHRTFWQLLVPFIYSRYLKGSACRVMQLDGLLPALICKLLWGNRVVVTYGFDYIEFSRLQGRWLRALAYFFYDKLLLPLADVILVPNKRIFEKFSSNTRLRDKCVYHPNGVDTRVFYPKKHLANKKIELLSVGRLEKQKNYDFLIRSIAVSSQPSRFHLTLIGSGLLKQHLVALANDNRVALTIIDSVPNEKLPKYYNGCDIYIQPSLLEGSPKAIIEAMSCGCCLIASNVSGNRDIISHKTNGWLFSLESKAFIQVIDIISQNSVLRKRLSQNARKTAVLKYDLCKIIEREIELIQAN